MQKPIVAIAIGKSHYQRMFSQQAWDDLENFAEVIHHNNDEPAEKPELIKLLENAEACITSWGVATLDSEVMAAAPRLKAMAHMGSSVKRFVSDAFWSRDMHLTSSGITLARTVAETTVGLMLVGMKRIWPLGEHVRQGGWRDSPVWERWISKELFRKQVGIIGASNVGRHVMELLQPYDVNILLYDPFVSPEDAKMLGATKLELNDLLAQADVVSLHAPSNKQTYQMLNKEGMARMKDNSLLINTGRGSLIDERALLMNSARGGFSPFWMSRIPSLPLQIVRYGLSPMWS